MTNQKKQALRKKFLSIRNALPDHKRESKSKEICRKFYANISIKPKSSIALFMNTPSEPDLRLLAELYQEDGHTLCLPCIEEVDSPMTFREYKIGAKLQRNRKLGFLEPPKSFQTIIPNVIITPLVAFDAKGNRIGQGGGYYDRTFDHLSSFAEFIAVGTAFKEQQADFIPTNSKDFSMDAIVTDERVLVF